MEVAQKEFKIQNSKFRMISKLKASLLLCCVLLLLFTSTVYSSESSYVLPYPSDMPGSFLYKPHLILERVQEFWHFGNFGKFAYDLKTADKYLVEAKTLFEYKQYLLGYEALQKSDKYFLKIPDYLLKAQEEGKDVREKKAMLRQASLKHIEVLSLLGKDLPKSFTWSPENRPPQELSIGEAIKKSIEIRGRGL